MTNTTERAKAALPYIAVAFGALYILSNILAIKSVTLPFGAEPISAGPVQIWPLVLDGAFLIYPLTYIIDDVLSEIYGFKTARRIIFSGFAMQILAVLAIAGAGLLPGTPEAGAPTELFSEVLGYVPRIVVASLAGFLIGELLNAWSLLWIRKHTGGQKLWMRLIGSTVFGKLADTVTFCTIAFLGTITLGEFLNYTIVGYLFGCALEVVLLPVTYRVIQWLKASPAVESAV